jgi:hypothetical protein
MSAKISQLPDGPYKKYAQEAERRGVLLAGTLITKPVDVVLLGALDLIRELFERVEKLEAEKNVK